MQALADSYPFWILLFAVLVIVYLLPTLIGMIRGVDQLALVLLVNLIGGLTGVGWLAAMVLAFGRDSFRPGRRYLDTGPRRDMTGPGWQGRGMSGDARDYAQQVAAGAAGRPLRGVSREYLGEVDETIGETRQDH
jgi:hypothetical protein